jgi:hypothetical protein
MTLEEILSDYNDKFSPEKLLGTLNNIKNRFKKSGLDAENISMLIISILVEIEKIKKLRPPERKALTITILNNFVEEICPGDDTPLEIILKQMVPSLLENLTDLKFETSSCFSLLKCKRD